MQTDWDRRLAERTMAVAVANGELVEVLDPATGEMYYAPASRYPTVEHLRRTAGTGGRHAAPKKPSRFKAGTLATIVAGIVAVPSMAVAAGTWSATRVSSVLTEHSPAEPKDVPSVKSIPEPMFSPNPVLAPTRVPTPAPSQQKITKVREEQQVTPPQPGRKRGKHRKPKGVVITPTPLPIPTEEPADSTPMPKPVDAQVGVNGLVNVDVELSDLFELTR